MGQNIHVFRGWTLEHEYFTHEWSDLTYLYLQCKQQLLLPRIFSPPKLPAIRSVLRSAISFWSNLFIFDFIVQASPRRHGNSSPRRGVTMSPSRHDNVLPRGDVSPSPVVHPVTSSPRKNVRGSFMNRPAHTSDHAHTSSLKPHPLSPAAKVATYRVAGI